MSTPSWRSWSPRLRAADARERGQLPGRYVGARIVVIAVAAVLLALLGSLLAPTWAGAVLRAALRCCRCCSALRHAHAGVGRPGRDRGPRHLRVPRQRSRSYRSTRATCAMSPASSRDTCGVGTSSSSPNLSSPRSPGTTYPGGLRYATPRERPESDVHELRQRPLPAPAASPIQKALQDRSRLCRLARSRAATSLHPDRSPRVRISAS